MSPRKKPLASPAASPRPVRSAGLSALFMGLVALSTSCGEAEGASEEVARASSTRQPLAAPVSPLQPRLAAEKNAGLSLPAETRVERVVVKFHEGTHVRLRSNSLTALPAERDASERGLLAGRGLSQHQLESDMKAAQALLERPPRTSGLARLFQEDEALLEARKQQGETASGRQLADLNLYYDVSLPQGTRAEQVKALVDALNALESVEVAYVQPPAEPAMVDFGMDDRLRGLLSATSAPPITPLFEGDQGYLHAAPIGIDARFAWSVQGGRGTGVRVVDIEGGWRTTHEDLPGLFYQGGAQIDSLSWRNHGTAVLGQIVGVRNNYGVTGIADLAQAGVSSIGNQSSASAIFNAASAVGPGGVILIELHAPGPQSRSHCSCNAVQCNYVAMEYWQADYDAIATATANGVTVVEAAGNGSVNLDDAVYGGRFNRSLRDSGAILVGASTSLSRAPMCWTNHGSRVDVHGWGENVVTTGYGDLFGAALGEDRYYTAYFSGTSSASPIVTGAVASLQGTARARGFGTLAPRDIRGLLATTGTPQAPDSRHIGPLPDLRRAFMQLAPATCKQLKNLNPSLGDGEYILYLNNNAALPWRAWCHGMAGTPTEYLTLSQAATTNFSQYTAGGASPGTDVFTYYAKVRIDPVTLQVNTSDQTFSTSWGQLIHGPTTVTSMPYASAMSCDWEPVGKANIDLRGTPFAVAPDQFRVMGWNAVGETYASPDGRWVDLIGGGYCGWNSLIDSNDPYNQRGGYLKLVYSP
ncbi:GON domain-containing protein [Comamonas sp. JC664]|uniref:GON domain-containing protein n=1 Tax=Comamonas sp. JC664 TaxID=2801917 RepID=UPI00174DFC28|nr:GON domain-containing protein [Comamonas sp. JC664]MBL0692842.1 S8 family serine peptidase [Comamonas sp. JC664]